MGMRIKVVMGYGLTDIQVDDENNIIDPRINQCGYLGSDSDEQEDNYTIEGFKAQADIEEVYAKFCVQDCTDQLYRLIEYDAEFGLPNVLCIIPPGHLYRWARSDDDIDYYLASNQILPTEIDNPCISWVRELKHPIYPFVSYIDTRTAVDNECTSVEYAAVNIIRDLIAADINVEVPARYFEKLNFSGTNQEFLNTFIPQIPEAVRELAKYTKIFTDDKYINDLRPIIYSYWS